MLDVTHCVRYILYKNVSGISVLLSSGNYYMLTGVVMMILF